MGVVATKCSELQKAASAVIGVKPTDAPAGEDEDGEGGEEEEEEEEGEEDEGDGDGDGEEEGDGDEEGETPKKGHGKKDAKSEQKEKVEKMFAEGPKRGSTAAFKQAIDTAAALGVDGEKIRRAEVALEQYNKARRREEFEGGLPAFLESDEASDLTAAEAKLKAGEDLGADEQLLRPLRDKVTELSLQRELTEEEVTQAKQLLEVMTRRFVRACVSPDGRPSIFCNLDSGDKKEVVLHLDLPLKNFRVSEPDAAAAVVAEGKLAALVAKKGREVEPVTTTVAYGDLTEFEKDTSVGVQHPDGHWLFLEGTQTRQDEFIAGITVLNGLLLDSKAKGKKSATVEEDKDKGDKKKEKEKEKKGDKAEKKDDGKAKKDDSKAKKDTEGKDKKAKEPADKVAADKKEKKTKK